MHQPPPSFRLAILALALALTLPASFAAAQNDGDDAGASEQQSSAPVGQLIDDLDAEDYERREQATTALMRRRDVEDPRIAEAIATADSPEQRHRLRRVLLHWFFRRFNPSNAPRRDDQRGSIGIQVSNANIIRPQQHDQLEHAALMISGRRPGFPGYALLRPGDLLVKINGHALADNYSQDDFIEYLKRFRAGQTVTFELLRHGRRRRVDLTMASYQRLTDVYNLLNDLPHASLYPPWVQHYRSLVDEDAARPAARIEAPESSDGAEPSQ